MLFLSKSEIELLLIAMDLYRRAPFVFFFRNHYELVEKLQKELAGIG